MHVNFSSVSILAKTVNLSCRLHKYKQVGFFLEKKVSTAAAMYVSSRETSLIKFIQIALC